MSAAIGEPLAAPALALPVPLMAPVLVMVLAVHELRRSRLAVSTGLSDSEPAVGH